MSGGSGSGEAGKTTSILSIIFGIVSFLFIPILFGLAGFVLGIIGVVKSDNKVPGAVGIALSAFGIVIGTIIGAQVGMQMGQ